MSNEKNDGELDDTTLDNVKGGIAEGGCVIDYPFPEPIEEPIYDLPYWDPYPLPIDIDPIEDPYPLPDVQAY